MSALRELGDRSWPLLRRAMGGHTLIYRASGGLVGHRLPFVPPTLLLTHVGAKSGLQRVSPLSYTEGDSDDLVLVASKGGYPQNPSWFHNLKAHPDTTVQVGREHRAVHARVATAEERKRLWPRVVDNWSDYAEYQKRTEREIPLVILERR
ncbi:MAG TPA: nitroreductase family deazaflavin-dependent oxidoreductase [Thermoleophilaceae bacterium]